MSKTQDLETQPKKRRKKKKRFGYYLYAVTVFVLTLAIFVVATFLLTYVQNIKVTGVKYSREHQIVEWVKEDPYTFNSVYTVCKYKLGAYELPSYLEDVSVGFKSPWELHIKVQEKQVVGCILSDNSYVYFADDGTVLQKGSEIIDGIPVVEGLRVSNIVLYEKLKIKDEKVFSYVVNISEEVRKNNLEPDRLVWEEDSMNLYFGEICVKLGKLNFDEKLIQVPPILKEVEGKKGTFNLEHYNEMSSWISFEEEEE